MTIPKPSFYLEKISLCGITISKYRVIIRCVTFLYLCFLTFMLLHPDPLTLFGWAPRTKFEKEAFSYIHVAIFIVLAFGTSFCVKKEHWLTWIILLFIYGPITEILQSYTGRSFGWLDIIQDSLGVSLGFALGVLVRTKLKQKVLRDNSPPEEDRSETSK